jgi:outer membrane protein
MLAPIERRSARAISIAATLLLSLPAMAQAQTLTLDEAMRGATEHPSVASAQADREVAAAATRQVKTSYGPSLSAGANLRVWSSPLEVSLGGGGGAAPMLPAPQTPYEQVVYGIVNAQSTPTTLRDQVTWDASLTLTQPLSALWTINLGAKMAGINETVATQQLDIAQRQLARDAAQAYFRVLQARAQLANAEESALQLESQLKRLTALVELGSANDADRLRIDVALASARQQALRAQSDLALARAALAVAAGKEAGAEVDVQDLPIGEAPQAPGTLEQCIKMAMESRQELAQLASRLEQSNVAITREEAGYIPQVVAMANYTHTAGQGLAGSDTMFIGASLSWTIYEWGKTRTLIDQAQANVTKVEAQRLLVKRQLELQVRKAWLDLDATTRQLEVARYAVTQAKEAYRVEEERFNAGRSTSTELLAAQAALVQAQNNVSTAYYQALVNYAELRWATGDTLTAQQLIAGANP